MPSAKCLLSLKRRSFYIAQDEIVFLVEESLDGGLEARVLGHSIYSEVDTLDELKKAVRDPVRCHFDEKDFPHMIRLHLVRNEILTV